MRTLIYLGTTDPSFAEVLAENLRQWGMKVLLPAEEESWERLKKKKVEVVLLDIRQRFQEALRLLRGIRAELPEVSVIVINRPDNIQDSLLSMQAGAADEILTPCDTGLLKKKINEACARRLALLPKKKRRSPLAIFSAAMAAASFAQAGEFAMAAEFLEEPQPKEKNDTGPERS